MTTVGVEGLRHGVFRCPVCMCGLDVVTVLTADGLKFTHPLHHIGKTVADLPLLVIDSFRHMYLWRHNAKTDLALVHMFSASYQ